MNMQKNRIQAPDSNRSHDIVVKGGSASHTVFETPRQSKAQTQRLMEASVEAEGSACLLNSRVRRVNIDVNVLFAAKSF